MPFFDRRFPFCRQLRFAKTDEVLVIAKQAANVWTKRMNAAMIVIDVVENAGAGKTLLMRQAFAELFRHGFQLFMYELSFLVSDGYRATA